MKTIFTTYEVKGKTGSLLTFLTMPLSKQRALTIALVITLLTMLAEFIASAITGSLMLFSDGLHMLSHASSLGVTYLAIQLAARQVGKQFPFGLQRVEILAALFNGLSLLLFSGYVIYKAVERFYHPVAVDSFETILIAFIGLAVNLLTAFILSRAGLEDLNTKSAFIHLLADTFSSVTIIIGGVVIYYTNWFVIDTLLSLVVVIVILKWAWGLIRDATLILLGRTPDYLDPKEIEEQLTSRFEAVAAVSEMRIWEVTTGKCTGSMKLYCPRITPENYHTLKCRVGQYLEEVKGLRNIHIELCDSQ